METVSQLHFCHSMQAKRDTESLIFSEFWMLACAGMTALTSFSLLRHSALLEMTRMYVMKESLRRNNAFLIIYYVRKFFWL